MATLFRPNVTVKALNNDLSQDSLSGYLKMRFLEITDHSLSAGITIERFHTRPGNIMSGGTTLALIETVGSVAGMLTIDPTTHNVFGIEVSANHISQVPLGESIIATAEPDHVGRTTQVWQVRIKNSKDKLVCVGRITLFVAQRKNVI